jgi:hypothetical protein
MSYQGRLTGLLWLIVATVLGLVLTLAVGGGNQLGGLAAYGVLAAGLPLAAQARHRIRTSSASATRVSVRCLHLRRLRSGPCGS